MSLIESTFKINTVMTKIGVSILQNLNGLNTNVYFPRDNPSVYNDSSNEYDYDSSPTTDGKWLFTGIYGEDNFTGFELEGYSAFNEGDARMYIVGDSFVVKDDKPIPRNSKLEVAFGGSRKVYRIQDLNIINGLDGKPIYGYYNLVPMG